MTSSIRCESPSNELSKSPPRHQTVFNEDVVRRMKGRGEKSRLAIVTKTYRHDDESDSSDEDDEEEQKLQEGHVSVSWHSLNSKWNDEEVETLLEKELELVDRSLLPGDVVRRSSALRLNAQKGHIKDVQVFVDLRILGTGHTLRNVDCKKLTPLRRFPQANMVALGPWLGVVQAEDLKVIIRLKNGSKCEVAADAETLVDATDQRHDDSTFYCSEFYPGQQVSVQARALKQAKWIVGGRPAINNHSQLKAVVDEVKLSGVEIGWHICGYTEDESQKHPPHGNLDPNWPHWFNPDICPLVELDHFREASIQIGDKAFYQLGQADVCTLNNQGRAGAEGVSTAAESTTANTNQNQEAGQHSSDDFGDTSDQEDDPSPPDINPTDNGQMEGVIAIAEAMHITPGTGSHTATPGSGTASHTTTPGSGTASHTATPGSGTASHTATPGSGTGSHTAVRPSWTRRRRRPPPAASKKKKRYKVPVKMVSGESVCVEIAATRTSASVLWQDGLSTKNVPSCELTPIIHLDELEFFPGDFVMDKRDSNPDVFGVVERVEHNARLCDIRWFTSDDMIHRRPGNRETAVSVYDIIEHPNYEFRPGDVVVRLKLVAETPTQTCTCTDEKVDNVDVSALETRLVELQKEKSELQRKLEDVINQEDSTLVVVKSSEAVPMETDEVVEDDSNNKSLVEMRASDEVNCAPANTDNNTTGSESNQAVGQVLFVSSDGFIHVRWVDGSQSEVVASELYVLDREHDDFSDELDSDDGEAGSGSGEDSSWETASEGEMEVLEDDPEAPVADTESLLDDIISRSLSCLTTNPVPVQQTENEAITNEATINEATTIASTDAGMNEVMDEGGANTEEVEEGNDWGGPNENSRGDSGGRIAVRGGERLPPPAAAVEARQTQDDTHTQDTAATVQALERSSSCTEVNFVTMETCPANHKHFERSFVATNSRSFLAALGKDVRLLRNDLSSGIFVRAFEDRMDLFSFLIVGPKDTPYEGGLFMFDLQLASSHPLSPPLVHYHSFCSSRLNPNLYEEGKVCVSLLGTWNGKGSEQWTSKSTIRQLLLSIQGLILVEEPYYNEAGYERQRGTSEGLENSRLYNEMAIVRTLESIRNILSHPPSLFADHIREHFRVNLPSWLSKLRYWIETSERTLLNFEEHVPATSGTPPIDRGESHNDEGDSPKKYDDPKFPLLPVSRAFSASALRLISALEVDVESLSR